MSRICCGQGKRLWRKACWSWRRHGLKASKIYQRQPWALVQARIRICHCDTAQVVYNIEWWVKSPSACAQWARTPPLLYAQVTKSSSWLERLWAIINREKVQSECREIQTLTNSVGTVDWTERNFLEVPDCTRPGDVRRQGVWHHDIQNRTQAEVRHKHSEVVPQKLGWR